jgi:hypothetical protein
MAGDNQSSSATVSAEDFQEVHEQIDQLMQGMQALQLSLQQQQRSEPPANDNDHIEDDDPSALEAEAACLQADAAHRVDTGGGGGCGCGDGRGLHTSFGNLCGINRGRNFLVVHDALLLEVLEILMLMIIPIIVMNREEAPMVTVVVMMLMVVLILATLEIMVTTSLANMVDTMINVAVIMNTAKMKMVWVKLKCPFPLSAERRMPMFILNGRPRWTRYLICIITQLQRRQSLLPLSLKVML